METPSLFQYSSIFVCKSGRYQDLVLQILEYIHATYHIIHIEHLLHNTIPPPIYDLEFYTEYHTGIVYSKRVKYISKHENDEKLIPRETALPRSQNRISKDLYYLEIARAVSLRGTCLRRNYGAVIVKGDRIVSTGYNGAPRGRSNCCDLKKCIRAEKDIPHGQQYELCRSVHAEQNAIIAAGYELTKGATLYLSGTDKESGTLIDAPDCCMMCKRVIINSGITKVIFLNGDYSLREVDVQEWVSKED